MVIRQVQVWDVLDFHKKGVNICLTVLSADSHLIKEIKWWYKWADNEGQINVRALTAYRFSDTTISQGIPILELNE